MVLNTTLHHRSSFNSVVKAFLSAFKLRLGRKKDDKPKENKSPTQSATYSDLPRIELPAECMVIAVLGPSGVGKTSFINQATGRGDTGIGHSLRAFTNTIEAIEGTDPHGRKVVFIDTPPFENSAPSDEHVLRMILSRLSSKSTAKPVINGVIYCHSMDENRLIWTPRNNLHTFNEIFGVRNWPKVLLLTTMWSGVRDEEEGLRREDDLRRMWENMFQSRGQMARLEDISSQKGAWAIIEQLTGSVQAPPRSLTRRQGSASMAEMHRDANDVSNTDDIIAVVGLTGSGKSSFINLVTHSNKAMVGKDMRSRTAGVQAIRYPHPTKLGRSIIFIDTPSFDNNTGRSGAEITSTIHEWFRSQPTMTNLTGVIYMHRMTTNKVTTPPILVLNQCLDCISHSQSATSSPKRSLERPKGWQASKVPDIPVVLVCSMWDVVRPEVGEKREKELKNQYWKPLIDSGSNIIRHRNTEETARAAVSSLLSLAHRRRTTAAA